MYRPVTPLWPGPPDKDGPSNRGKTPSRRRVIPPGLCLARDSGHVHQKKNAPEVTDTSRMAIIFSLVGSQLCSNWFATRSWVCSQLCPGCLRPAVGYAANCGRLDCGMQLGLFPTAADLMATRSWVCIPLQPT